MTFIKSSVLTVPTAECMSVSSLMKMWLPVVQGKTWPLVLKWQAWCSVTKCSCETAGLITLLALTTNKLNALAKSKIAFCLMY